MVEKIPIKKKWVSTSAWRGYEDYENSFAWVTSTGDWSDSPYPRSEAEKTIKGFKAALLKAGIPFRTKVGITGNFSGNMYFITNNTNYSRARAFAEGYSINTDSNLKV